MKQLSHFSAFLAALMSMSLSGCASTAKQEGTRDYFDDGIIPTKVKMAFFNEPSLKSAEIPLVGKPHPHH